MQSRRVRPVARRRRNTPTAGSTFRVMAERLGMPLVRHDDARSVVRRTRDRGDRSRARRPRWRRISSCRDADGKHRSSCRACAARRCCWSRGPRGEAAASTCPCGRHCEPSCIRSVSRSSPSRSTSTPTRRARSSKQAQPEHPSLIDQAHVLDELFGFVNVPNGVWIDEDGMIVRPAEPAHPGREPAHRVVPHDRPLDACRPTIADDAARGAQDPQRSRRLRRDGATTGSSTARTSRYALAPDEVVRRSRPRGRAPRRPRRPSSSSASTCTATATTTRRDPALARSPPAVPRQLDLQAPGLELRGPGAARPHRRVRQLAGSRTSRRSAPRTTTRHSNRKRIRRTSCGDGPELDRLHTTFGVVRAGRCPGGGPGSWRRPGHRAAPRRSPRSRAMTR